MSYLYSEPLVIDIFSPDSDIKGNKSYTSCKKKGYNKEIVFSSQRYKLCVPKKAKDDILYLALYGNENGIERFFYLDIKKKKNIYFYIDTDHPFRYYVQAEKIDNTLIDEHDGSISEASQYLSESFFGGESFTEITETPEEIKKLYGADNTKMVLLSILLFLIAGGIFYYIMVEDTSGKQKRAPKPIVEPLSSMEKALIRNSMSQKALGMISNDLSKYASDKFAQDKFRIVGFTLNRANELMVIEPTYDKEANRWYWNTPHDEKFKRGGFTANVDIKQISSFPALGYRSVSETRNIWEKTKHEVIEMSIEDTNRSIKKLPPVSEKCLAFSLYISENIKPIDRASDKITLKAKGVSPSEFVNRFSTLLKECPVFFESVTVLDGKFIGEFSLYRGIDNTESRDKNSTGLTIFPLEEKVIFDNDFPEIHFVLKEKNATSKTSP